MSGRAVPCSVLGVGRRPPCVPQSVPSVGEASRVLLMPPRRRAIHTLTRPRRQAGPSPRSLHLPFDLTSTPHQQHPSFLLPVPPASLAILPAACSCWRCSPSPLICLLRGPSSMASKRPWPRIARRRSRSWRSSPWPRFHFCAPTTARARSLPSRLSSLVRSASARASSTGHCLPARTQLCSQSRTHRVQQLWSWVAGLLLGSRLLSQDLASISSCSVVSCSPS